VRHETIFVKEYSKYWRGENGMLCI